jgi:hypothetical protein
MLKKLSEHQINKSERKLSQKNYVSHLKSGKEPKISSHQGRTGHITRWEKSHGAPLDRGPRQSGAPQHHELFFFFRSALFVEIFCLGGGNSSLEFLFNDIFFFFWSAISYLQQFFFFFGPLGSHHPMEFASSTQNPKKFIRTPNKPIKTIFFSKKLCFVP